MKKLELSSDKKDNIWSTLEKNSLDRNHEVYLFLELLNQIEDSFSISINGDWGSGKTFFVKQCILGIETFNSSNKKDKERMNQYIIPIEKRGKLHFKPQLAIYYDAWKNDNSTDPILSIIYSIVSSDITKIKFKNKHDIRKIVSLIAKSIKISGRGIDADMINALIGDDLLENEKEEKTLAYEVTDFLKRVLSSAKMKRLVIFVDELDRCRPSYAVKLLERIKHYFNSDYVTFVFSTNLDELQYTIKHYYGEQFDGDRYLDRFFDLTIVLPKPNMNKFYKEIGMIDSEKEYDKICIQVIEHFQFGLREVIKYYQKSRAAVYQDNYEGSDYGGNNPEEYEAIEFAYHFMLPFILGLRMHSYKEYDEFIAGKNIEDFDRTFAFDEFNPILTNFDILNDGECFTPDSGENCVSIQSKLGEAYNALFNTPFSDSNSVSVGHLNFTKKVKERLNEKICLLSDKTDFEK